MILCLPDGRRLGPPSVARRAEESKSRPIRYWSSVAEHDAEDFVYDPKLLSR